MSLLVASGALKWASWASLWGPKGVPWDSIWHLKGVSWGSILGSERGKEKWRSSSY